VPQRSGGADGDCHAENSPHHTADAIGIPVLVIHGSRDLRVPVSEALRPSPLLCGVRGPALADDRSRRPGSG